MKKLLLITLMATCAACSVPAWAEDKAEPDDLQILFEDSDIIKDGQLDKGEFDIFHYRAFYRLDADGDGILLSDECTGDCFGVRMWTGRVLGKEREMADIIRRNEFISTPYRFESIDKNSNGQLSLDEYIGFGRERFKYFDGNSDGTITAAEFCTGYHSSMPCDFSQNAVTESE